MNETNPFKLIEPTDKCPAHLKTELLSEIDLIRNVLNVVEIYAYDIFTIFTITLGSLAPDDLTNTPNQAL